MIASSNVHRLVTSVKGGYPTLFSTLSEEPLCVLYSDSYRNTCTLKSCSFIGPEHEYIVRIQHLAGRH